jgi:hypothetical protein
VSDVTFAPPDPATFLHDRFAPTPAVAAAPGVAVATIGGSPTPEEAAAALAAVEALWPRPVVAADAGATRPNAWRFSGRWWARPVAARRERPW